MAFVQMNRRLFLKTAGISLALPYLESAWPRSAVAGESAGPLRMVLSWYSLGFHTPNLYPDSPGRNFAPSRYLRHFDGVRDQLSVIKGFHQAGRPGGHGTKPFAWRGYPYANYLESLDVFAGRTIGRNHRFANLAVGGSEQSIASNGVPVPSYRKTSQLFAAMFIEDTPQAKAEFKVRLQQGYSILDTLHTDAERRRKTLSPDDARKMDQYLEALRQSEKSLQHQEEWATIPKPKVQSRPPEDVKSDTLRISLQRQMYDMIYLALASDSTRVAAYLPRDTNGYYADVDGVDAEHHGLTHHGMREEPPPVERP